MAIYKYSHKLRSPQACGGGNRILTMTDEIMTVLLTRLYSPTHSDLHFPLRMLSQAAAASFH